ncbi:SH3 and multiple ankyrin repeat domains protein 3-like [Meleagris gallopavo]|uniref:SH3 and multiple ankyrin repeat domains protein 3-like n=1 Tax=Meleagris gallopavo TaxID=9103 RepID=UPI00093CBBE8|nr:SH3 and multiple ankyrin repeat domains protein 3-like [Meleagris gallopavo]
MAAHAGVLAGAEKPHVSLRKGIPRTKSVGEDEKLAASLLDGKFPRSTSMQDTVREGHGIPPPPQTAPPPPPSPYYFDTGPPPSFSPPPPPGRAYDTIRSSFKPSLEAKLHGLPQVISAAEMYDQARTSIPYPERQKRARSMIILQDSSHLPVEPTEIPRPGPSATPPEKLKRKGRVIDNPYANMGQFNVSLFAPTKPQRKKSPLVKQLQVEDAQERAALSITGGFAREPSPTRRSHRLSGVDYQHHAGIAQVEATSIPFATAIAGVMKDRDRRLDEKRKSTVFLSVGAIEGTPPSSDMPSLQQSRSIDERLLGSRDVLLPSPVSALKPLISSSSSTFIHPLTGKPLDPNSPLALALAARERALSTQVPSRSPTPIHSPDSDRAAPLFVDIQTKEPERVELESLVSPAYSPGAKGAAAAEAAALTPAKSPWGTPSTLRKEAEARVEAPGKEEKKPEDKKSMIISIVDTSQQKTAGLIMVHATSNGQDEIGLELKEEKPAVPEACAEPAEPPKAEPQPSPAGKRRSKLWGDPMESRPIHGADDDKPTVISELSSRLQQLNKDTQPAGSALDPGKKSPVVAARLFSSLGELSTISQRSSGTTYTVRPGSRYPVTRRTPSPVKPALDRTEPLSTVRPYGLTPPTILKSSSLSIPHEPKEVRFVVRSVSARSRSPSPSPSPGPPLHTLHPPRPFMQKPLHLWNKYDVGDWLESINLVEHRDKFEDHEIEGTHLPALTKEDFVELGVTRVGHRMNIERALKQLVDS